MRLLALLSGENVEMARAEFLAFLEKQGIAAREVALEERILAVEAKPILTGDLRKKFEGLALVHEVCEFIGEFAAAEKMPWKEWIGKRAVAIQAIKVPNDVQRSGRELAKRLGAILFRQRVKIDMASKEVIRIYLTPKRDLLAHLLWQRTEDFEARRPHLRPFAHPIAMHPRFARAMVNLARVKRGDNVLDPFCGTAGTLIEAGLLGAKVFGIDITEKMVGGARKNLRHFGIRGAKVELGNALKAAGRFDAVVTELPFGRAAKLTMEKDRLRKKFLVRLPQLVKRGGFAILSVDTPKIQAARGMKKIGQYTLKVHGGLTRYVFVFKKAA